jgi:type IX secretion system PorP/SprF family membrane protein
LGKAKLAFGLRGGMFNSRLDVSKLNYTDPGDRFSAGGSPQTLVPTIDFGTYLYSGKFFAGLSSTHLTESRINYPGLPNDAFISMKRHFMFSTGAALPVGAATVFKPTVLLKYTNAAPINIDVNASFLFNKVFWLGAGYRSSKAAVLIFEYNIKEFIRIGYSYDIVFNRLKSFTTGTHEFMLGFDLNLKKTSSISPRYL